MKVRIPRQPECNIGTAGHVDHGKCLAMEEYTTVGGRPLNGWELLELVSSEGRPMANLDGGQLYALAGGWVYSLNPALQLVQAQAYIYIERYSGPICRVRTRSGRSISVTPQHPLLVSRGGRILWAPARQLAPNDHIAAVARLSLEAPNPLEFDPLDEITTVNYEGYVYDLTVPTHRNFIGGLDGLVCHNTTLVQGLTGIWTSAHSEELRRGITIRVGYADAAIYKCEACPPPDCYTTQPRCPSCGREAVFRRAVSFVDCPGHESLMANMLSGAALMDGALLVIAANERVPQPQTREHLQALQMLGTSRILVVQNKLDLVTDEEALQNYRAIKEFLKGTRAEGSPIIPISAQHSVNLDALIEAIEETIPTPKRDPTLPPLLPLLRSFDVNRPGTPIGQLKGGVVGGSLIQGRLQVGDEVEIRPGLYNDLTGKYTPIQTRVVSLGTGAGLTDEVHPGGLVAVGTQLDPSYTKADALVGHLLGKPGTLPPIQDSLTMKTQLFEVAVGDPELRRVEPLRTGETLRLNVATAVTVGTITSIRGEMAEVKLRRPICAPPGARVAISRRIADRWRLIGSGALL